MAKKRAKSEEPKKTVKSEEPKKKKPISLNILEIAKRLQKLEQTAGMPSEYPATQVMMSDGTTSVEDALDGLQVESGTFNLTPGYFINSVVNYKKQGNVVTIFLGLKASAAISSSTIIGVVPDGLKPSYSVSVKSAQGDYGLYLDNNGNLSTLGSINANAWVYATLTYIV